MYLEDPSLSGHSVRFLQAIPAICRRLIASLLDWLTHHCHVLEYNGDTYPFKKGQHLKQETVYWLCLPQVLQRLVYGGYIKGVGVEFASHPLQHSIVLLVVWVRKSYQ